VDFRNTLVIMTSNLGSQWILDWVSKDHDEMERRVQEALRQHFRPEFLNRVDEVIVFHSLTRKDVRRSSRSRSTHCAVCSPIAGWGFTSPTAAEDRWRRRGTTRTSAPVRSSARFSAGCRIRSR
jgi:hypothetical protein